VTTVIGAGLAGSLLALELAERGHSVTLIDAGPTTSSATALSYGLLNGRDARAWQGLQHRHGDLGLGRRWLQLGHAGLPLPAWQVTPGRWIQGAAAALAGAGVPRLQQQLSGPAALQPWLDAGPVVLTCGAGCRTLAPQLDARLWVSWAGVLELEPDATRPWLGWRAGLAQLPARFERLALERRAAHLQHEDWVVDAGLVPCGDRLLAGQISLIRPTPEAGSPPDAAVMEQRLRMALAARWPQLADTPGRYRQAPVSFCSDGAPLAGPCGAGLWVLAGFSGAFAQIPAAARCLADQLAAN